MEYINLYFIRWLDGDIKRYFVSKTKDRVQWTENIQEAHWFREVSTATVKASHLYNRNYYRNLQVGKLVVSQDRIVFTNEDERFKKSKLKRQRNSVGRVKD